MDTIFAKKIFLIFPFIGCLIAIFIFSSLPGQSVPQFGFVLEDKIKHIIAYCITSIAGVIAFRYFSFHTADRKKIIISVSVFLFVALYGISDEFHQSFVPGRSAEIADWFADLIGSFLGCTVVYSSHKILPQNLLIKLHHLSTF